VPAWDAEWEVGSELAGELIAEVYPQWAGVPLELVGRGWDNEVWRCGEVAFRFPRREIAVRCLLRELAVLPGLREVLPLAIPDAAYPGRVTARFEHPWFGSTLIAGRELAAAGVGESARAGLAEPLAGFLRALHSVERLPALPVDPNGRADMSVRVPRTREALAAVGFDAGPLLDQALRLPAPGPARLLHGDLHARHLLVDGQGAPAGIIDWGDVCLGDVAIDLSVAFAVLPAAARSRFFSVYGAVDEACLVRARVLALCLSALLLSYARAEGLPWLADEARGGLLRSISGL
jgi:aminoglycoside phosphotransferase (APT) family kinase protein